MAYSSEMIEMVEQDVVKKLDFQLNYPTSLDFVLQVLYLEDQGQGKVEIEKVIQIQNLIQQAMPIILLCQNEYKIGCTHSQISIGLGSLIWILSKRHLTDAQILLNYIMVKV
jgi:hypothetical protein